MLSSLVVEPSLHLDLAKMLVRKVLQIAERWICEALGQGILADTKCLSNLVGCLKSLRQAQLGCN